MEQNFPGHKRSVLKSITSFFSISDEKLSALIPVLVAFTLTGLLLRVYEILLITQAFVLPTGVLPIYPKALASDLFLFSFWSILLALGWFLIQKIIPRYTLGILKSLIILFFLFYIGILQYFGEVLVPLGVDFWAYNFGEISDTINTSASFDILSLLPFFLFPIIFWGLHWSIHRINLSPATSSRIFAVIGILGLISFFFTPKKQDYEKEVFYALSVNKASYFFGESANFLLSNFTSEDYSGQEYPLMKTEDTPDVLGPYFKSSDRPPNFVFIIVESLGGTLVPPNASYGGFTPFLDSLASQSLYWTHFLATSGRSFNAQPSIFGSLPYGNSGFMDLGYQMPEHHSLISILNNNGYQTNYFGGYNTNFDNLNQFLERQNIDLLVNESRFPPTYEKMDMIEGNFTWGYSDHDLYDFAFTFLDDFPPSQPRLDIFFTLNFHEPFIIPNKAYYEELFQSMLGEMDLSQEKKAEYRNYTDLFSALLYTDDSIRGLMNLYKQRADYENTIFVITGDHRMVPIPHRDRIARYYVPFMIYSPLLKTSREIKGVSSHLDVTPSLLGYLTANFPNQISVPEQVHWLGDTLSTSSEFTAEKELAFMRTKNQIPDYLSGDYYLSDSQLFKLYEGMLIGEIEQEEKRNELQDKLNEFQRMNQYVTQQNKLLKLSDDQKLKYDQISSDTEFLRENGLMQYDANKLFEIARDSAFHNNFEYARILLRHVVRVTPDFHDARILLGRTYAWSGDYSSALPIFEETLKRAPNYQEVYVAIADLFYWQELHHQSMKYIDEGLEVHPDSVPLIFRKARTYYLLKQNQKTSEWIEKGLNIEPSNTNLNELKLQLASG